MSEDIQVSLYKRAAFQNIGRERQVELEAIRRKYEGATVDVSKATTVEEVLAVMRKLHRRD